MSQLGNPYQAWGTVAANAEADQRARFIRLTYAHLAGAVMAFLALESVLLSLPGIDNLVATMLGGRYSWLIVMAAFIGASYLAQYWAQSSNSVATQYLGLGLYVVAEAVIFVPLLLIASRMAGPQGIGVIPIAGFLTLFIFAGLTGIVFLTGADFSFLGTTLRLAGWVILGVIAASFFFPFTLGIVFIAAVIFLAAGYILYDTSNVLHHYRVGQHVAASLALFASVALLFWYILQLVMSLSSRD
jgi:FtsH-binding integral membrane protein